VSGVRIAREAIIDLKPYTVYRRFPNRDWHTVEQIECRHEAHGRISVYVHDFEGGGWSAGSEFIVEVAL
jgi:hypothetical protein